MDGHVLREWIDSVLAPSACTAPAGIVPLLLLDSDSGHLMESVQEAIHQLGVRIIHIPGGCICHSQPLDMGINCPFKSVMRHNTDH
jgi:DDE superfamily endonuclease